MSNQINLTDFSENGLAKRLESFLAKERERIKEFSQKYPYFARAVSSSRGVLEQESEERLVNLLTNRYGERIALDIYHAHLLAMESRQELENGR